MSKGNWIYFLFGPRQTGKTSLIRIADIFLLPLALKHLVRYRNRFLLRFMKQTRYA
jgi:predicted AAA+ superfamily ATPase